MARVCKCPSFYPSAATCVTPPAPSCRDRHGSPQSKAKCPRGIERSSPTGKDGTSDQKTAMTILQKLSLFPRNCESQLGDPPFYPRFHFAHFIAKVKSVPSFSPNLQLKNARITKFLRPESAFSFNEFAERVEINFVTTKIRAA